MKFIKSTIFFTFLINLIFINYVHAETHEALVTEYIKLSGITDMFASFPEQIKAVSSQKQLVAKQPEKENKITELLADSFDINMAEENLYNFLLQNTDKDFFQELIKWMDDPLVKRILEEEKDASDPEKQAMLLHYIADLQNDPPSLDRITLIQDMEKTLQLSDLTTHIAINMMKSITKSINSILPDDKRSQTNDIHDKIMEMEPLLKETYRQQLILSLFYIYRNISNEELKEYMVFYKSNIGKRTIDVNGKAIAFVLEQWTASLEEKLVILAREEFEEKT